MRPALFILPVILPLVGLSAAALPAAAHDDAAGAEPSPSVTRGAGAAPDTTPGRWRGSVLLFDQSLTTQTVGVGSDYQSYDPTYEWWVAVKPKYTMLERQNDSLSLNLWMNFYLELTNSDTTTEYHELLVGPTYLWASYGRTLRDQRGYKTAMTIGPRVTLPTDKAAYDIGEIVDLGATGGVSQTFPLRGEGARALQRARLGIGVIYGHPFDRYTTPINDGLHQLRQDVAGRSIIDDQVSGEGNVRDYLTLAFSGELRILRRLDLALSYVLINQWRYPPTSTLLNLMDDTGPIQPTSVADPTTYGVKTWLTASLGYDLMDELSVSLGYYNLANQIGPDGTRRNPLWSPSARFFLTFTSNLDAVYRRLGARGHAGSPP